MSHDQFPTYEEDPLAGDVDKFVHPDETRTDAQIAYDEKYAVVPYGDDAADDYWAEYDELDSDDEDPKAEDKYEFTEKDIDDRKSATTWLKDVAADYEKQRDEKFDGSVSHYSSEAESKALSRVLENGFYATSDDNVHSALRTIETGTLLRADYFSSWPDGSYKAAENIKTTELDLNGLREFTDKFAGLQRQREEVIVKDGTDPLAQQMQEVFAAAGSEL